MTCVYCTLNLNFRHYLGKSCNNLTSIRTNIWRFNKNQNNCGRKLYFFKYMRNLTLNFIANYSAFCHLFRYHNSTTSTPMGKYSQCCIRRRNNVPWSQCFSKERRCYSCASAKHIINRLNSEALSAKCSASRNNSATCLRLHAYSKAVCLCSLSCLWGIRKWHSDTNVH